MTVGVVMPDHLFWYKIPCWKKLCAIHNNYEWHTIVSSRDFLFCKVYIYKASQPRGRASGSRAYGRHEMQGVIFKSTRHECSAFVNLRPLLLRIRSRHQFSSPEKTERAAHAQICDVVRSAQRTCARLRPHWG